MRIVTALALSGCVTQTVHSRPSTLATHEAVLAAQPAAAVEVEEGGTAEIAASREVTVWVADVVTLEKKRCLDIPKLPLSPCIGRDRRIVNADVAHHVTVRELVTGCAVGDCLAKRAKNDPIEVGTRTEVSSEAVIRTIGAAALTGAGTYCLAECDAKSVAVGAFLISALLLYQPLSLLAR